MPEINIQGKSLSSQLDAVFGIDRSDNPAEKPYTYLPENLGGRRASVRTFSVVPRTLQAIPNLQKWKKRMKTISRKDLLSIIVSTEAMLPELPVGVLATMLDFEMGEGATTYNPSIVGGSGGKYLGLFQFFHREANDAGGLYAWGAARAALARRGIKLPSLADGWSDPASSTLAAAGLALANRRVIEKARGSKAVASWEPIVFYAAHQQGAGYVIDAIDSGRPATLAGKQSGKSEVAIRRDLVNAIKGVV